MLECIASLMNPLTLAPTNDTAPAAASHFGFLSRKTKTAVATAPKPPITEERPSNHKVI
jgi:hypothetical protein